MVEEGKESLGKDNVGKFPKNESEVKTSQNILKEPTQK